MRSRSLVAGLVLGGSSLLAAAVGIAASSPAPKLEHHLYAPELSVAEASTPTPAPTATPRPQPYAGPVAAIYLSSANVDARFPIEQKGTVGAAGHEVFADPDRPGDIAWYSDSRFGHPGFAAQNSVFAAHINYFGYGDGPFAHLTSAHPNDSLYITMANGETYTYNVIQVSYYDVSYLEDGGMQDIVYPSLDSYTERVTLISCGGDFVPYANGSGAGEYTSRVVLTAERFVP
jgi:sortase family protein